MADLALPSFACIGRVRRVLAELSVLAEFINKSRIYDWYDMGCASYTKRLNQNYLATTICLAKKKGRDTNHLQFCRIRL